MPSKMRLEAQDAHAERGRNASCDAWSVIVEIKSDACLRNGCAFGTWSRHDKGQPRAGSEPRKPDALVSHIMAQAHTADNLA